MFHSQMDVVVVVEAPRLGCDVRIHPSNSRASFHVAHGAVAIVGEVVHGFGVWVAEGVAGQSRDAEHNRRVEGEFVLVVDLPVQCDDSSVSSNDFLPPIHVVFPQKLSPEHHAEREKRVVQPAGGVEPVKRRTRLDDLVVQFRLEISERGLFASESPVVRDEDEIADRGQNHPHQLIPAFDGFAAMLVQALVYRKPHRHHDSRPERKRPLQHFESDRLQTMAWDRLK
mmetsp:Transcript_17787/g.31856  ORF Transcript_17787/g.31856 Transcript_17787/m.31856 type:complete len:227 (-) Transcript_17787:135-815(-)